MDYWTGGLLLVDVLANILYTHCSNELYHSIYDRSTTLSEVLFLIFLLILVDFTHTAKITRLYLFIAELDWSIKKHCVGKFEDADLEWVEEHKNFYSTIELHHLNALVFQTSSLFDIFITTTTILVPVFYNLGPISILILSFNLLFYFFYSRNKSKKISREQEEVLSEGLKKSIEKKYYEFYERLLQGRQDSHLLLQNIADALLIPYSLSTRHFEFYLARLTLPSLLQYTLLLFAIQQRSFTSALLVLRAKSNVNQILTGIFSLEKVWNDFNLEWQPLLDLLAFVPRGVAINIDLRYFEWLSIENIKSKHLHQEDPLHINLKGCERILLDGTSGAGKTTLLKYLAGFYYLQGVKINVDKRILHSMKGVERVICGIGNSKIPLPVSRDNFIIGDLFYDENLLKEVIIMTELHTMTENIECLSEGETTRLLLARSLYRAMFRKIPLLILDEPDKGLPDKMALKIIQKVFSRFQGCLIVAVHREECKKLPFSQKITFGRNGHFSVGE